MAVIWVLESGGGGDGDDDEVDDDVDVRRRQPAPEGDPEARKSGRRQVNCVRDY